MAEKLAAPSAELDVMTEIGSTGLKRNGGLVQEEFLRELSGTRWHAVIREMTNQDAMVGAVLLTIDMMLRRVSFTITSADDSDEAEEVRAFVEGALGDMSSSLGHTLSEIFTMLPWGWSWLEICYKERHGKNPVAGKDGVPAPESKFDDGKIGWRKWSIRAQETLVEWVFDEAGGIKGFYQSAPPNFTKVFLPIEKSLHFRTQMHKGNPEGKSILRTAYRSWYFKKHVEQIEGIGIERDLAGLPVMWVPPKLLSASATPEERSLLDQIKDIVQNVRRDEQEGVVMPLSYDENGNKKYDFALLSSAGQRQFDTDKVIKRHDLRMAMSMLADFILLGHEQVGSKALAVSRTSTFASAITVWLDVVCEVIQKFAFSRLLRVNDIDRKLTPGIIHSSVEAVDLEEIGNYIKTLSDAGMPMFPNDELSKWLAQQAGLPEPPEDSELETEE